MANGKLISDNDAELLAGWILSEHLQSRRPIEVIRYAWFVGDDEDWKKVKALIFKKMEGAKGGARE